MRDPGSQPTKSRSNIYPLNNMLHCFSRRGFLSSLLSCFCEVFRESQILATQPPTGCRLPPSSFSRANSQIIRNLDLCASLYHLHRLSHHKNNLQTYAFLLEVRRCSIISHGTLMQNSPCML